MTRADWYFDFISPFSYLQAERLASLPVTVHCKPVLFAGLLDHWGQKGPAEIGAKRRFTYRHVVWLAHKQGIPLKFPPSHPFNPLPLLRLAVALGSGLDTVQTIFRFVWRDGLLPDSNENLTVLAKSLGLEGADELLCLVDGDGALRRAPAGFAEKGGDEEECGADSKHSRIFASLLWDSNTG